MNQLQHALQDYQEVYTKGAYHFVQKDKMIIKFVGKYFRFQTATSLINEEITRVKRFVGLIMTLKKNMISL